MFLIHILQMLPVKFCYIQGSGFIDFQKSTNQKRELPRWRPCLLTDRDKMSNLIIEDIPQIVLLDLQFYVYALQIDVYPFVLFSSPGPKVQVNYCHHLASVACRLLSVVCKLFTFQASSPKPLGRLEPNLAGMFLGWSSTKLLFFDPVGYSIWLPGPIICSDWLKFQRSSSLKLMN